MELLTEWFPGGKYIKLDTHFHTNFVCDKYLLSDVTVNGEATQKAENY